MHDLRKKSHCKIHQDQLPSSDLVYSRPQLGRFVGSQPLWASSELINATARFAGWSAGNGATKQET